MRKRFMVNSFVRILDNNDTYIKFRDIRLRVVHVATRYMPSDEFFRRSKPSGYHPGFDSTSQCALYDLETYDGKHVPFSLYDWELDIW